VRNGEWAALRPHVRCARVAVLIHAPAVRIDDDHDGDDHAMMTRRSVAAVVALVLGMPSVISAGWRAECRRAARECRMTHGASLTTMSTTSTTLERTTCPSQNCGAQCVFVNGYPYVDMFAALNGECELFRPPDCSLCSTFCSSTTTTSTTTTTGP